MSLKQVRQLSHKLKTDIDKTMNWIRLSQIGDCLGATSEESSEDTKATREMIVKSLEGYKKLISEETEEFLKKIDFAIEKMK